MHMVEFLKSEMENGLEMKFVTSSPVTKKMLLTREMPIIELKDASFVDIYFDGCDQFDKNLNALKSGGGIHTHEKLLASMAQEFILVGDDTKYADALETKYPVVVEIIPESLGFVPGAVKKKFPGVRVSMRVDIQTKELLLTDNKNYLVEIWFDQWPELSTINPALKSIAGIIETSLFYQMANKAVVAGSVGVRVITTV